MKYLIKQATVIDPTSTLHQQVLDLLIHDGKIVVIAPNIPSEDALILTFPNLHVSIGWLDIGVQTGEPGLEQREDLQSVTQAAATGGFTAIAVFPNTQPVVHSRTDILFFRNFAKHNLVELFPIGAVTWNTDGKDISEMYDMYQFGAVAFSDGKQSIQHAGVMLRALEYVKSFDGIIVNHPHDQMIAADGQMHEGTMSTTLGLPGIPRLAEELMLYRDLELLAYTQSRLHVQNISTANSVAMIRQAKQKGLRVSAAVSAMNLALTDEALDGFQVQCKVQPPLREWSDIYALIEGLKDGTIDTITSNHVPLELEAKMLEFPYAKTGAVGLETAFAVAHTALGAHYSLSDLITCLTQKSRTLLDIAIPKIAVGESANLTLFDPTKVWMFERQAIRSKSKNSPFIGKEFKGKVLGIIRNDQVMLA
ncbi:MAG: dihydroorotase [Saprospiraceae bacterium]|nr:dihydroorotase [Saprospiraceae bacterium]